MTEIYQNKGGTWTKVAGDSPLAVGAVYETLDASETAETLKERMGGTWEALPDRVEDAWKEYPCTYTEDVAGTITEFKLYAKVSEDKQFVDVQVSCSTEIYGSTSTSVEWAAAKQMTVKGTLFTLAGVAPINLLFVDKENASQTASFYISGNNTLWFGGNKLGIFKGEISGRKLIPYNSVFTPDRTFKRFKRVG